LGAPFQKVRAGQPLQIPAQAYNGFVDAAVDFRGRQQEQGRFARDAFPQTGIIKVKNNSGVDRARFDVLGIDGPVFTPTENLDSFVGELVVKGALPDSVDHFGNFVVLLEPLAAGDIGRGCLSGGCPARVYVVDPQDEFEFADVADGESDHLLASESGSAFILWRESGSGVKWAYVRLSNIAGAGGGSGSGSSAGSSSPGSIGSGDSGESSGGSGGSGDDDSDGDGSGDSDGSGGDSGGSGSGGSSSPSSSSSCVSSIAVVCKIGQNVFEVINWGDPNIGNLTAEDGVVSETDPISDEQASVRMNQFGFSIPAGAVIVGVRGRIKGRKKPGGEEGLIGDSAMQLLDSTGNLIGAVRTATPPDDTDGGNEWPESLTEYTYGGENDLWGLSSSQLANIVNTPLFGCEFSVNQDDHRESDRAEVDFIELCIYYEACV